MTVKNTGETLLEAATRLVNAELTNAEIREVAELTQRAAAGTENAADWSKFVVRARVLLPRAALTVERLRQEIADTVAETQRYLAQRDRDLGVALGERNEARDKLAAALRELEHVGNGQDRAEANEIALHAENVELREERDALLRMLEQLREKP